MLKKLFLSLMAGLVALCSFTPMPSHAACGCVVSVAANKCPINYASPPAWWELKDRYGNVKPWPNYNVPVPVSDGDKITVMWSYNCCPTVQGNDAVALYYTTCPPSGMHFATYPLSANRMGATWQVEADCATSTFRLVLVAGYGCD